MVKTVPSRSSQVFRPVGGSASPPRPGVFRAAVPHPPSGAPPVFSPSATPSLAGPYRPAAVNGVQPKMAPPVYRLASATSVQPKAASPSYRPTHVHAKAISASPVSRPFATMQAKLAAAPPPFRAHLQPAVAPPHIPRNTLQAHGLSGVLRCGRNGTKRKRGDDLDINLDGERHTATSTRPSRSQRKADQGLREAAKKVGKREGTRGNDSFQKVVKKARRDPHEFLAEMGKEVEPTRTVNGDEIFKGNNRSFPSAFRTSFWAHHSNATCAKCRIGLTLVNREIDHKKAWSVLKLEIQPTVVCKGGVHWEVITKKQVMAAVCDGDPDDLARRPISSRTNLQPMCQSCNGSKSGSKHSDSVAPQKMTRSIHEQDCDLLQAT
jgi:hypothetical protein